MTGHGRWVWGLSGVATAAVLALPAVRLLGHPGVAERVAPGVNLTRTVTMSQPITSLNVQSDGEPVQVSTGSGPDVRVTELISYAKQAGPPHVQVSVAAVTIKKKDPACSGDGVDCGVAFIVIVPSAVRSRSTAWPGRTWIPAAARSTSRTCVGR